MTRSIIHRFATLGLAALALSALGGTVSGAGTAATTCLTWHPDSPAATSVDAWRPAVPAGHADPHTWNPSMPTGGRDQHPWNPAVPGARSGDRPWHPDELTGRPAPHVWHPHGAPVDDCESAPATNR